VASREADIIQAEAQVRNSQSILGKLINLPREKGAPAPAVVPTDIPGTGPMPLGLEEAETRALANRADLAAYRIGLETRGLNLTYARNQSLPSLNFRAAYWSPGLSGTQILYQDDDPLTGIIVGTVPGGPSMAFKDAFRFGQENWFVGLTFELPLGPVASRAGLTQAKLESEQALLRIGDLEQQILLEVETEVRAVETDHKRALAYQAARELAEETLAAEEKKLKAGMSTNYTVLMQQRDLALARTNEIKARVDYNLSLARLDRAMGTTLKSKNINLTEAIAR
jgi:outer membrane protein TolC